MQFRLNNTSPRPVYIQIIDQVKRDIALGRLIKGEKLPTVRELALQLAINPNTIAKAYKQLEQERIINTKPGAGAFIADIDSNLSRTVKRKLVSEQLEMVIIEAFHMQIERDSLLNWFENALEKFNLTAKKDKPNE